MNWFAKHKKALIIIAIVVVIIVALIVMIIYKRKKAQATITAAVTAKKTIPAATSAQNNVSAQVTASEFPLKQGSTGTAVKMLQIYLNSVNTSNLPALAEDGIFGVKTLQMLKTLFNKESISKTEFDSIKAINPILKILNV